MEELKDAPKDYIGLHEVCGVNIKRTNGNPTFISEN